MYVVFSTNEERAANGGFARAKDDGKHWHGETQERLFANEDNEKLLQYFEKNGLTTKEVFDRFAVNLDANDPNNVLKLDYGQLDDYDGYHSHDGAPDEGLAQAA